MPLATMAKATVAAVLSPSTAERRTVLLTKRTIAPFEEYWCLPGGHIDPLETAEQAVVREVAEETGLSMHAPECIGYCDEIFPEYNFHAEALIFFGTATGEFSARTEEVSDIRWFSLEDALGQKLAFHHKDILQRYESHIAIP